MGANSYKQLCWRCKKSCDMFACVWVRTLKRRPKGCEINEKGYIVSCPKFEKDNLIYRRYEKNKVYILTKSKYRWVKMKIKKQNLDLSVVDYLKQQGYYNIKIDF